MNRKLMYLSTFTVCLVLGGGLTLLDVRSPEDSDLARRNTGSSTPQGEERMQTDLQQQLAKLSQQISELQRQNQHDIRTRIETLETLVSTLQHNGSDVNYELNLTEEELLAAQVSHREELLAVMHTSHAPDISDAAADPDLMSADMDVALAGMEESGLWVESVACEYGVCRVDVEMEDQEAISEMVKVIPWEATLNYIPEVDSPLRGAVFVTRLSASEVGQEG